jgi:hypothetical protein
MIPRSSRGNAFRNAGSCSGERGIRNDVGCRNQKGDLSQGRRHGDRELARRDQADLGCAVCGQYVQLIRSFDSLAGCIRAFPDKLTNKDFCDVPYLADATLSSFRIDVALLILLYLIYVLTFYRFYVGN